MHPVAQEADENGRQPVLNDELRRRVKLNLEMGGDGRVVNIDTGKVYELPTVAASLRWRPQGGQKKFDNYDPLTQMPLHWYVVLGKCDDEAWDVLSFAISKHPDSYMGYFRGYQYPMRYLELGDGYRYWPTVLGVQMLNRCTLNSVEAPRRVDQGARPICWQEWGAVKSLPRGSGWSEEDKREHPELFGEMAPPPCAHGAIVVGDRVKHLSSKRYGTVTAIEPIRLGIRVRWDNGKTSSVGKAGLRTPCCLPGEWVRLVESVDPSAEGADSAGSSRSSSAAGRAEDIHQRFWTQFAHYLEGKESPIRMRKPTRRSLGNVASGPGAFRLIPWNVLSGTSGVWVRLTGSGADALIDRIESHYRIRMGESLSALGELIWLPRDSRGSVLSLRCPSELSNQATWPELNAWMSGALEVLHDLLRNIGEEH